MARMTYVNWGIKSGNRNAMKTSMDIINGDKTLEFGGLGKGHYGHAGVNDNVITLNNSAIDISKDTMGKAGYFTGIMSRESYLLDRNKQLGLTGELDQEMRENGLGKQLTREASGIQSQAMNDIAKNMGVQFDGQWGERREQVDYAYDTGDVSGFDATGRDSKFKTSVVNSWRSYVKTGGKAKQDNKSGYGTGDTQEFDTGGSMYMGEMVSWNGKHINPSLLGGAVSEIYSDFLVGAYEKPGNGPAIFGNDYEHNMRRIFVNQFFEFDKSSGKYGVNDDKIQNALNSSKALKDMATVAGILTYQYMVGPETSNLDLKSLVPELMKNVNDYQFVQKHYAGDEYNESIYEISLKSSSFSYHNKMKVTEDWDRWETGTKQPRISNEYYNGGRAVNALGSNPYGNLPREKYKEHSHDKKVVLGIIHNNYLSEMLKNNYNAMLLNNIFFPKGYIK